MDITKLTIEEVSTMLETGKITSVELVNSAFEVIENTKHISALISTLKEGALNKAKEIDQKRASGEKLHKLAGIPITIKDNINVFGFETTCASKFLKGYISPYNATLVEKLENVGAIIIGKNNMDEFAMGSSTEHSAFGPTLNPLDTTRVPGGSSGGSAASVASGQCFASIGTDTGGSVRQPASLCGVVALKPTYGTVSRYGIVAFASSLDQAGPITKNVIDNALVYSVIKGKDNHDSTSVESPNINLDEIKNFNSVKGLKVGLIKEFYELGSTSEVGQKFSEVVEFLKSNGAEIKEVSLPNIKNALACYYVISSAEAASNLARFDGVRYGTRASDYDGLVDMYFKNRTAGFGKEVKRRIMLGNFVLSSGYFDAYYKKAKAVQQLIINQFKNAFSEVDVILTPTSPTTAFKIGEKVSDVLTMYLNDIYTVPVNIAELPAISLPCGNDTMGLPIGLQIIGNKFTENTLYKVAHFIEKSTKGVK